MTGDAPYLSTPVVVGDYLYTLSTRGILSAINAKTGKTLFQQRLGQGTTFSASLIAASDLVYGVNEMGEFYIFRSGPKYDEVSG